MKPLPPSSEKQDQLQSPKKLRWLVALNAGCVLAYFLTARLGLLLAMPGGQVTAVWPPSGVALAAVLFWGWRVLPGLWFGSVAINIWASLTHGPPHGWFAAVWCSAVMGGGAVTAAGFGGWALGRLRPGRQWLEGVGAVTQLLVVGGLLGCLISATVGTSALRLSHQIAPEQFFDTWLTYWLGDAGGVFVVTPFCLAWALPERWRLGEMGVCLALVSAVSWFVFVGGETQFFGGKPLAFLALPFLVWAALRMGLRGASTGLLIVAVLAVWGTAHGRGPLVRAELNHSLLSLEIFLASWVFAALSIAAVVRERERANTALERQRGRMNALATISLALNQHSELGAVLKQIVRAATDFLPANGGASVVLWDAVTETFTESATTVAKQPQQSSAQRVRREGGASRWIVEHDQAVVVPDVAEDPFVANSMLPEFGLQAYAGVPLTTGEQVIGVLYVMNQEPHSYSEEDLRFVSALASRAASAVIKAKLYEDLRFARDKLESQVTERTASLNVAVADLHRKNQALWEAEMATRAERDFSHKLIQSLPGVFYLVNPERRFLRWNKNLEQVTGYSGDELRAMLAGQLFLPEELGRVTESFMTVLTSGSAEVEASFLTRDGRRIPYFFTGLRVMSGGVPCMVGVGVDISERKRAEALMRGHKQILERIATAAPLPVVLEELVRFVEAQDESLLCALQVLGPAGLHVRCVVAPSLPAEYNQAIENQPIGPCAGSCGTAAFRQEAVIVEDIATDPLWADYRAAALAHGLRSCWSTPVFDATHKVLGTFAIYERRPGRPSERHLRLIDIATQVASIALSRVRDEQELRESELRHRLMAEIMAGYSFAYRISPDGVIKLEWATRPMEQVIGYSEADLKEDVSFRGLIHPEDRSGQQAALERVMAGEPEIMEFRLRTKGGLWRWLRCYNRPEWSETERRVVRILGAAQDITDRKQAELELRRSETRLEEAQARAQLGSWELELAGLRGTWSAEMSRLHGRDPALGAPLFSEFLDLIHPEDRPLVVHVQAQLAASTQPISHEYRTHPTLGPVRHLAATVEVIRDASGQAVRAVGTTQDITGRKQAEQAVEKSRTQLRALLARLQRARELERTRIAREVHDVLGQLLTGFKMDLAWCERRVAKITEEPLRRALEEKLSGTTQLTDTMIESVQKISRELRPSVLDNLGLAAAIESEARQFQKRSGIACQAVLPTEEFALEADRATEVFRIFQEALTNVARHAQATRVRIRLVRNADSLELEVADNGLGISEDKLSNTESLGLLGMRERAAAMGGEIQLGNAPEGGTTVRLTIPEKTV